MSIHPVVSDNRTRRGGIRIVSPVTGYPTSSFAFGIAYTTDDLTRASQYSRTEHHLDFLFGPKALRITWFSKKRDM